MTAILGVMIIVNKQIVAIITQQFMILLAIGYTGAHCLGQLITATINLRTSLPLAPKSIGALM